MTSSTIVVFGALAMFFVFITVRGELPQYLAVFGL